MSACVGRGGARLHGCLMRIHSHPPLWLPGCLLLPSPTLAKCNPSLHPLPSPLPHSLPVSKLPLTNRPLREWEADGGARFNAFLQQLEAAGRRDEWVAGVRDAISKYGA